MPQSNRWTHDQLLATFSLYCRLPFGKFHQHNHDIICLASALGRTPSAVAMKLCNIASLDDSLSQRGLEGASQADRTLWNDFLSHPNEIALQADLAYESVIAESKLPTSVEPSERVDPDEFELLVPEGPSEQIRPVKIRRLQTFFRTAVLSSYEYRCAISGLELPELLIASHIVPWRIDEHRRADPRNGLCLNALYDKAFDRGLITFDNDWRVILSPRVSQDSPNAFHRTTLLDIAGARLQFPTRFAPDVLAMDYHRQNIFLTS